MALNQDTQAYPAAIAAGGSLSASVPIGAKVVVGIACQPTGWLAAAVTFQVSVDGVTWQELYDTNGNEITVAAATTAAGAYAYLDPSFWRGINMIKVRSGTAASPVIQTSGATVNLIVRSEA